MLWGSPPGRTSGAARKSSSRHVPAIRGVYAWWFAGAGECLRLRGALFMVAAPLLYIALHHVAAAAPPRVTQ
jgi:hypothetical protein